MTKETRLNLVKNNQGQLCPADDAATEALRNFAAGELVPVRLSKERNPRFHKLYFAMLNTAFENQEVYQDFESFRAAVTVNAGYFVTYAPADGSGLVRYPKSIAWDKMDDIEFHTLYSSSLDAILRDFLAGTDPQAFQSAVEEVCRFA